MDFGIGCELVHPSVTMVQILRAVGLMAAIIVGTDDEIESQLSNEMWNLYYCTHYEPLPKKWTLESQRNSTRPHIVDSKINRRPRLVDSNKYP